MKRIFSFILVVSILICVTPVQTKASEKKLDTIYFEDGSYMTVEVITKGMRASGSVSGSKPYTYYGKNGTAQWKATLSGSFTYTGSSATCTSSSVDVTVYDSSWYTISKSSSKSGSKATASVTMGEKLAGVTVTKVPISLAMTCDKNGNLS